MCSSLTPPARLRQLSSSSLISPAQYMSSFLIQCLMSAAMYECVSATPVYVCVFKAFLIWQRKCVHFSRKSVSQPFRTNALQFPPTFHSVRYIQVLPETGKMYQYFHIHFLCTFSVTFISVFCFNLIQLKSNSFCPLKNQQRSSYFYDGIFSAN